MPTVILLIIAFAILVQFLWTMSKCLNVMGPSDRAISPASVWWNLVPVFNIVWLFVTAIRFAESVDRVVDARGLSIDEMPRAWGIASASLFAALMLTAAFPVAAMIFFGLWVFALAMYWKCVTKLLIALLSTRPPAGQ